MNRYAQVAFTESVQQVQQEQGSWRANSRLVDGADGPPDPLGDLESLFISARDGFYLGSVGETGWPYVQFRGGPPGFVHVLDNRTLAYADVRGNRQYITNGNLRSDNRVSLFFMDYPNRTRLKVLGYASTCGLDEDARLADRVSSPRTDGRVERVVIIRVEGHNWNCPQHIPRRFTLDELSVPLGQVRALERDKHALTLENQALRRELERIGRGDADAEAR